MQHQPNQTLSVGTNIQHFKLVIIVPIYYPFLEAIFEGRRHLKWPLKQNCRLWEYGPMMCVPKSGFSQNYANGCMTTNQVSSGSLPDDTSPPLIKTGAQCLSQNFTSKSLLYHVDMYIGKFQMIHCKMQYTLIFLFVAWAWHGHLFLSSFCG